ncbi:hypothetical protein KDI_07120 [Dictyobacter arantiisoli]|uniref:Polyketide synthase n=1 Tax=Dictyobacter arantiisoli TaxID=2014874 RepID=A0A5A5T6Z2_9CHLR|nr:SDR family NAD(P)-dependent oxidoreductase [Dictyobacter arantiisoli]GCF07148.1 hypothetical protein KDI_07120 [Dictyobacter arantiisoli]
MNHDIQLLYQQIKNKQISHEEAARHLQLLLAQKKQLPASSMTENEHTENLASTLPPAPATENRDLAEKASRYLRRLLSKVIELPAERIEIDVALEKYGIDSIMAMELTNELEQTFGPLPKTLFFEYQTIQDLTTYFLTIHHEQLRATLGPAVTQPTIARDNPRRQTAIPFQESSVQEQINHVQATSDPSTWEQGKTSPLAIAIIGLAGKYPQAENIQQFWENLAAGKDCIREIPANRWDHSLYFDEKKNIPGKTYSKWGGFLDGIENFDPLFFNISPLDAEIMDPQERLFLQCAYETLEDAGYIRPIQDNSTGNSLDHNVGVFVGVMYEEYQLYGAQEQIKGQPIALSGNSSSIANRVSYFCNFNGPSVALNTMCSSSLTAIHLACQSLQRGECKSALAGGVNVSLHPNKYLLLGQGNFASSKGRCESFGAGGDGYVPGEGVGAVLLKPLHQAIADQDHIYGVIKGTAINHGGKTNGYTVPTPNLQAALITQALKDSGINPQMVSYIEAHGTGTALGDPIEIAGLTRAFQAYTYTKQYCSIGSVKSNIGHCESAAGIAGLTKILLQMQHKLLVPSLHSTTINPNIDLASTPFFVQQELAAWQRPQFKDDAGIHEYPRIAGISSFGAGGSNAHILIEEYIPSSPVLLPLPITPENPAVIVLSARTADRLRALARQLLATLDTRTFTDDDLAALAYTLQVGREALEERLAFTVTSIQELKNTLKAFVEDKQAASDFYRGQVKQNKETLGLFTIDDELQTTIDQWVQRRKYERLLDFWTKGLTFDWNKLYGTIKPQRISLPTYPFEKKPYWRPAKDILTPLTTKNASSQLHPLLHRNTSDFSEQRFSSRFSGHEFFLRDHVVQGHKVLPGVAYLEMAHEALKQSLDLDDGATQTIISLKNVVWLRPIIVDETPVDVHISLSPEENGNIDFEIYTLPAASESTDEIIIHSQGTAILREEVNRTSVDLMALQAATQPCAISPAALYQTFADLDIHYGPTLQSITDLYTGQDYILAKLTLPASLAAEQSRFDLHPSLLDASLQATLALLLKETEDTSSLTLALPFALHELEVLQPCPPTLWAHIRFTPTSSSVQNLQQIDLDLLDESGNLCLGLRGYTSRTLPASTLAKNNPQQESSILTFIRDWQPAPQTVSTIVATHAAHAIHHLLILCETASLSPAQVTTRFPQAQSLFLQDGTSDLAQRFHGYAERTLSTVQHLLQEHPHKPLLLQLLVHTDPQSALFAGLFAMLQSAQAEYPTLNAQLIVMDTDTAATLLLDRLEHDSLQPWQNHLRYQGDQRLLATWRNASSTLSSSPLPWREKGIYLITGGLGGLGFLFAQEIIRQAPQATLILLGRSALTDTQQAQLQSLAIGGAHIDYQQVDVANTQNIHTLVQNIVQRYGGLHGILHSAGVLRDSFVLKKTTQELHEVLAPKVDGVINLDEASKELQLDFFVLFSSLAAVLGNAGQSDYATANAFMDAYASYRTDLVAQGQRQGRTLSLNWPLWEEGGMQVTETTRRLLLRTMGMLPLHTASGMQAFYHSLQMDNTQALVIEGYAEQIKAHLSTLLAPDTVPMASIPPATQPEVPSTIQTHQDEIPEANDLTDRLQHALIQMVSKLFKVSAQELDIHAELSDYGFDSIALTQFANALNHDFDLYLTPTIFFECPTLHHLTKYLLEHHQAAMSAKLGSSIPTSARQQYDGLDQKENSSNHAAKEDHEISTSPAPHVRKRAKGRLTRRGELPLSQLNEPSVTKPLAEAIAIVGISGTFPQAGDLNAYWHNLLEGKDCISEIPRSRWDWRDYYGNPVQETNKTNVTQAGIIDGIDEFDPLFFKISPQEAELMDPQQRLLMTYVWKMLEDAGYTAQHLAGSDTGLFVGTGSSGYYELITQANRGIEGYSSTALIPSMGPSRMSYFLNWHGPSEAIETACSSSLVAIHHAVGAIERGDCTMAVAGGINTIVVPDLHISLSKAGMLCADGHCKPFSALANGYVRGEGVGMLLLKKVKDAEADGDHIYGIIRSTAMNHGGHANSLTAPNPEAQAELLISAYTRAGIDPRTIGYIEAHGTGTPLGDPIEINGLKSAFKKLYQATGSSEITDVHCGLGSVKSNIGHLELAAGVAGVIKVLLQMKHQTLVKSLHCEQVNPYIQLDGSPFYLVREKLPWKALKDEQGNELPRRAGVSSFGFGGVNAHVVIEEYRPPVRAKLTTTAPENPALIVLSARDEPRLKEYAHQLLTYLEEEEETHSFSRLAEIAYTLQVGREAMEERLALLVHSLPELQTELHNWLQGQQTQFALYRGQVKNHKDAASLLSSDDDLQEAMQETVKKWLQRRQYGKLLEWWVRGLKLDWNQLYGPQRPARISLPTYPFAREHYWVSPPASQLPAPKAQTTGQLAPVIHPLVQQNISDFFGQRFRTTLTGQEFFLRDHIVQQQRILPAVAYLEMAYAAITEALQLPHHAPLRLSQIVWLRPISVGEQAISLQIELELLENTLVAFKITDQNTEPTIFCQGNATILDVTQLPSPLDISRQQQQCQHSSLSAQQYYEQFSNLGIAYGPTLQALKQVTVGDGQALARLALPASVLENARQYTLHPSFLDSAFQAALSLAQQTQTQTGAEAYLPFELQELEIFTPTPVQGWAWIRARQAQLASHQFDLELCDEQGQICIGLRGLTLRPSLSSATPHLEAAPSLPHTGTIKLTPIWDAQPLEQGPVWPLQSAHVALIGVTPEQQQTLKNFHPNARILPIEADASIEDLSAYLLEMPHFEHIFWVAPERSHSDPDSNELITTQNTGVMHCFRFIKALLQTGYATKALGWTVLTQQTYSPSITDKIMPTHAALYGLLGSLAKEYPHWQLRLVDLPAGANWPFDQLWRLPADPQGNGWLYHHQQWYRQRLMPLATASATDNIHAYRTGGVYVVIGGAGGIGTAWTDYMLRHYQAQVIWIGRRNKTTIIQERLQYLAQLGPAPEYITADASDEQALTRAYKQIKERYGQIHGVIHAAITLHDQSLQKMDEESFRTVLTAKVDVSVRLAQVFQQEHLDFVLFFSSFNAFARLAGQSNYAAGCTFVQAFTECLRQDWSHTAVKVINWGYWGSIGIVSTQEYRERMAQAGLGSIEPAEAMMVLEELLSSPINQYVHLKATQPQATATIDWNDQLTTVSTTQMSLIKYLPARLPDLSQSFAQLQRDLTPPAQRLDTLLGRLLMAQLQTTGWFSNTPVTLESLKTRPGFPLLYDRWLSETIEQLAQKQHLHYNRQTATITDPITVDSQSVWQEWEEQKALWSKDLGLQAQITLVETALRALPDILNGHIPATDVLFPHSSMHLVESLYKHNQLADFFNKLLAEAVLAYLTTRIEQNGQTRLRILEIGAGTGGSSALIFEKLRPYQSYIQEYCYTDISQAFLWHAEQAYGPQYPYLTYQLFDIEASPAEQGMALGTYDLVIAANVLHATHNMRQTVRHAKSLLQGNGLLLLNELSQKSLFLHLTFGLLEGWWRYEDPELRMSGSPTLTLEGWKEVLYSEGFDNIYAVTRGLPDVSQQVLVAESNGVIRQRQLPAQALDAHTAPQPVQPSPMPIITHIGSEEELRQQSTAYFKTAVAEVLKLPVSTIDEDAPLANYGLDSILVVQLTERLRRVIPSISSTVFFEYTTVSALVDHFLQVEHEALRQLSISTPSTPSPVTPAVHPTRSPATMTPTKRFLNQPVPAASQPAPDTTNANEPIAIVGLAGRYPGAPDLDTFWQNLLAGRSAISEIPAERWKWQDYFEPTRGKSGSHYTRWGGFLSEIDTFDPTFFGLSPQEARLMDPQERLFLEAAYACIQDAGYTPEQLDTQQQVGIFVGVMNSNYPSGARYWSIANRISYLLNFHGPSIAVDSACSASLTAIHLACESLRNGDCACALVGGVNLIVDPVHYLRLSEAGMLSASEQCRSFGEEADGFVDSEGVGAILLKPLTSALADGDHIYGLIKATAISHSGKTHGYTVPSPQAEAQVIAKALQRANVPARSISYLEAHGSGTALGDAIEIAGLSRAYAEQTTDTQYCSLGSVKSNIGHAESASGMAGLTKILLQFKHQQLVPSLHAHAPNHHINFKTTPFVLQKETAPWTQPYLELDGKFQHVPRRAGLSSFGAGGANAHLIVEEYISNQPTNPMIISPQQPALLVLSAKTELQLREIAQQLLSFLQEHRYTQSDLPAIAYTLQVGREALEERLALQVTTLSDIQTGLDAWLEGQDKVPNLYRGQSKHAKEAAAQFVSLAEQDQTIGTWIQTKNYAQLLQWWVQGQHLDWNRLYSPTFSRPRRISLPTYPFAREHYWLTVPKTSDMVKSTTSEPVASESKKTHLDAALNQAGQELPTAPLARKQDTNTYALISHTETKDLQEQVQVILIQTLSMLFKVSDEDIDPQAELGDYGFDSITFVQFTDELNKILQLDLTPPVLFEYTTLHSLTAYLMDNYYETLLTAVSTRQSTAASTEPAIKIEPERSAPDLSASDAIRQTVVEESPDHEAIAIVGMSGSFPMAKDLDMYWQNLREGKDCISEIPPSRWDWQALYGDPAREANKTNIKWGGFIDGVAEFDPLFFGISPREAELMDPQQRLLMTYAWKAIEDAGIAASSLAGSQTGIFVGTSVSGYSGLLAQAYLPTDNYSSTSFVPSIGPNRMSFFLNIHGPSEPVETACSSSLVAIHHAMDAMANGSCEMAIVGGVNTIVTPDGHISFSKAGMLAPDGRCKTFSAQADGYVRSEGVGMLVLKKLSAAERDGNHIYGLLRSAAENHGGRASTLTAPNPKAEADVLVSAYTRAGIDPGTVTYIETHGTGTELGDPIEINGLKAAFKELYRANTQTQMPVAYCGLGSVKSNIGHAELAAGIAGVIKVLLQLKHKTLVKTLHCETVNPYIQLKGSPFYLVQETQPWVALTDQNGHELPRRAGVSSFGFGGVNAHVVIEEYRPAIVPTRELPTPSEPVCIVLSAKNKERLHEQAEQLLTFIQQPTSPEAINLTSIAFTLQVGRTALEERLAFTTNSLTDLTEKLTQYIQGLDSKDLYQGRIKRAKELLHGFSSEEALQEMIEHCLHQREYEPLLDLWTKGLTLDWNRFYHEPKPARISLPTYPFARDQYWVPANKPGTSNGETTGWLHPLLQQNTSDFTEQRFSSRFSGNEFFLHDHLIQGHKVLPAAAYLEMAHAAISQTLGPDTEQEQSSIVLSDVHWRRPITVDEGPITVHISLTPIEDNSITFTIYTGSPESTSDRIIHCEGKSTRRKRTAQTSLSLPELQTICNQDEISRDQLYAAFHAVGIDYGARQQAVQTITPGTDQALARLALPENMSASQFSFVMHPSLLDAALQATIVLQIDPNQSDQPMAPALPFALHEIEILHQWSSSLWAFIRRAPDSTTDQELQLDLDLFDEAGTLCARLRGYTTRMQTNTSHPQQADPATLLLLPEWQPAPLTTTSTVFSSPPEQHLLILCEPAILSAELIENRFPQAKTLILHDQIPDLAQRFHNYATHILHTIQNVYQEYPHQALLVQLVGYASPPSSLFSGLFALLQTARIEYPDLIPQLLMVDSNISATGLLDLLEHDRLLPQQSHLRYQENQRLIASWREAPTATTTPPLPWKEDGIYLITGGMGGLGLIFAQEIARRAPQATLLLIGRSALTDTQQAQLQNLATSVAHAGYQQVDVTDTAAVHTLIGDIVRRFGRLHGILHSAGVLRDSVILKKTAQELDEVLAPKVDGVINLDEASKDLALDFFLLFSSLTAITGNAGQGDYAAANAFLDSYADYRAGLVKQGQRQGRTLALNWPLWEEGGMHVTESARAMLKKEMGLLPMPTSSGINALYTALALDAHQVAVLWGERQRLQSALLDAPSANTGEKTEPAIQQTTAHPDSSSSLRAKTLHYIRQLLSSVAGLPLHTIEADAPLEQYGIDSLMILDLNRQLASAFGPLSKTLFFEYQTLDALSDYFLINHLERLKQLIGASASESSPATQPANRATKAPALAEHTRFSTQPVASQIKPQKEQLALDIAIIGVAGRYPQAQDLQQFWHNLAEGKDCITEIPRERWDYHLYYDEDKNKAGKTYSKWGGFIEGIDQFDPLFFNISPREAEIMDPQERLFLQCAYATLEDAGYTRDAVARRQQQGMGSNVGVYVGVMYEEYQLYGAQEQVRGRSIAIPGSPSTIANRVSYFCNFSGPSVAIDTMCSSSLTAIHLACGALLRGECTLALAGGVNVSLHPNKYLNLAQGKFVSSKGRCESFGAGGDGYVPGEGVGAILLKPLAAARADGDHIYGIIKGTAVNHGGKTNGYTVPNPNAQASVINRALTEAQIDPRTISYIEAHGTGTFLGDPIEIAGLTKTFQAQTQERQFCAIGSVKSNIGHCESAAGIAGVTKVLLQMKHRQLVPSLHTEELNPNIDFSQTPFTVQQQLTPWHRPTIQTNTISQEYPRRAGISAFGAGGSNAHIIIEEYVPEMSPAQSIEQPQSPALIVLSAKNTTRLKEQAQRLLATISEQPFSQNDITNIAYTLQVGREAMDARLAFLVHTLAELKEQLQKYVAGTDSTGPWYQGQARRNHETFSLFATDEELRDAIEKWIQKGKYDKILQVWVNGLALDWNKLYAVKPQRISLPGYPFARERYWIPTMNIHNPANGAIGIDFTGQPLYNESQPDQSTHITETVTPSSEAFTSTIRNLQQRLKNTIKPLQLAVASEGPTPAIKQQELQQWLQNALMRTISGLLIVDLEHIDIHMELKEYGFDQLTLATLRDKLNHEYQLELSPTIFFDYPTVSTLAHYLINTYEDRLVPYFQRMTPIEA